eukprot:CAMPEP_0185832034 /NCGR_PEP_ID=MMETSP1353-20130828/1849_1 /TAXON_ID=1077150 /ORGANISM="Erythrolobus australicus, Strain CCMP3124" /LENGTH=154 /DNA_ID=CAMNT_0028530167 /DNA_START=143 /DNA_END=607 /DNA_ORIENTATION=-
MRGNSISSALPVISPILSHSARHAKTCASAFFSPPHFKLDAPHSRAVLSALPNASNPPSDEIATKQTNAERPSIMHMHTHDSGAYMRTFADHSGEVLSMAFSRNGMWLASGSYDQAVRLWDANTASYSRMALSSLPDASTLPLLANATASTTSE